MSIPKEPRQLMINLMYLVLTALLALNVSAEIIKAFFKLGDGLDRTNGIIATANDKVVESMAASIKKKPDYKALLPPAEQASEIAKELIDYIDGVKDRLTERADGAYTEEEVTRDVDKWKLGRPKRYKDKEIPTLFFVDGYAGGSLGDAVEPEGPPLRAKVEETRDKLIALVNSVAGNRSLGIKPDEVASLKEKLTLNIDTTDIGNKTWEDSNFGHMPVAACYPILAKFQNDARTSEASIVNYLASKIGATTVKFDKFQAVASAEKGYVIKGETYKAEIFLSAASSQSKPSITVDGSSLPVKDGIATYQATPSSIGEKSYKVNISLKNPFTGKVDNFSKTFKYEVGERSANVSAEKMNVFYVGVTNPVAVSAGGIPSRELKVNCSGGGCSMTPNGKFKYNVTVSQPGQKATVTLSGGGLKATPYEFRVKRIPDPKPCIGTCIKSAMGTGEFKGQEGIYAKLENFDFEAKCTVDGFEFARVPKRADPILTLNRGGRFSGQANTMKNAAKPGDIYYFSKIKARCPGDKAGRQLPDIVMKIK